MEVRGCKVSDHTPGRWGGGCSWLHFLWFFISTSSIVFLLLTCWSVRFYGILVFLSCRTSHRPDPLQLTFINITLIKYKYHMTFIARHDSESCRNHRKSWAIYWATRKVFKSKCSCVETVLSVNRTVYFTCCPAGVWQPPAGCGSSSSSHSGPKQSESTAPPPEPLYLQSNASAWKTHNEEVTLHPGGHEHTQKFLWHLCCSSVMDGADYRGINHTKQLLSLIKNKYYHVSFWWFKVKVWWFSRFFLQSTNSIKLLQLWKN